MPLVHAENGDVVVPAAGALLGARHHRAGGPRLFAPAGSRGRSHQPRHHDRRHGGLAALYRAYLLPQAHEAITRARAAGKRVFGEPLIQHLVLDESEYQQQGLGLCGAPRDVAAVPPEGASGLALGRPAVGLAAGRRDRPLLLHDRAEAHGARRFPQDSERHRRARGPHAGAVDGRRQHRPADQGGVRRGHLGQYRPHPQHLSAKGAIAVGSDADIVIWDPEATKTISAKRQVSRIDYNVFEGIRTARASRVTRCRGRHRLEAGRAARRSGRRPLCRAPRPSRRSRRHRGHFEGLNGPRPVSAWR